MRSNPADQLLFIFQLENIVRSYLNISTSYGLLTDLKSFLPEEPDMKPDPFTSRGLTYVSLEEIKAFKVKNWMSAQVEVQKFSEVRCNR